MGDFGRGIFSSGGALYRLFWDGGGSLVIAVVLVGGGLRSGLAKRVLDNPNNRSMHTQPTPRFGGICILIAAISVTLLTGPRPLWFMLALSILLALISFLDDLRSLPIVPRLGAQLGACLILLWFVPPSGFLAVPLVLAILWVTNLFNFMDGIDGLAGGMAVIGFAAYAVSASTSGAAALAVFCICLSGAALGFLLFNFPPAKIFMGDSGAIPIGFLAAALGYYGYIQGVWPFWFPIFVFSPFLSDATVTLIRRFTRGEKVLQPHRIHYYQRMARKLGHRSTTLCWYVLMLAGVGYAYLTREMTPQIAAYWALSWCLILGMLMAVIDFLAPSRS